MDRQAGLDATRTVAMLLVVAGHAAVSFMTTPVGWAIQDRSQFLGMDLFAWLVRAFAMPTFFWLSGYAARSVLVRRGTGGYLRNRLTRIFVPLAVALVPCSLALSALWDWGREVGGRAAVADSIPKLQGSEVPVLLGHLWYLYYLLFLSVAALGVARVLRGIKSPSGAVGILVVPAGLSIGALGYLGALHTDTPLGFVPDLPILIYMGGFFAWGWLVHARPTELEWYRDRAWQALGVAAVLLATVLPALAHGVAPLHAILGSGLFTLAMIIFFVGACVRHLAAPTPWRTAASDATYWCYIAHLPIVVGLQILVAPLAIPGAVKYAAILTVTLALCLGSYNIGVRRFRKASRIKRPQR
ncbi:MAG: acyltransferase [Myxococcota bacterium]|nr:acyltransferase [Myxococcota bacterium]